MWCDITGLSITGRGAVQRWVALCALLLAAFASHAEESVCARVKIEIAQELTLERQGFDANMRIINGLATAALENVGIVVNFTDEAGAPVVATSNSNDTSAKFYIRVDTMTGINNVDGTGTVAANTTADIHWLIVPSPGAGGSNPVGQLYFVGASLSYTLGGEVQVTEVTPDFIRVKPMPQLTLDYFLTKDVYADDPFTTAIEPSEPFTLGVRVKNTGAGTAGSVKIDSAQPKIVENEQGLLIGFEIIGSSVNDQPATPSLLVELGDIAAGKSSTGRWNMTTTLSGQFVEFSAGFKHADELGGQLTSLIQAVNTHSLVHDVLVDVAGRDPVRDFLAKDGDVWRVYESDSVDTEVTNQSGVSTFPVSGSSGADTIHTLTTPITAGLMYVQLPDPYGGTKVIKDMLRSDGKRVSSSNFWLSRTQDKQTHQWSDFVNFFDTNSTGSYQVTMGNAAVGPQAPVLQHIPNRTTHEGKQVGFLVEASDPDGTIPSITAAPLPVGVVFNGAALWTTPRRPARALHHGDARRAAWDRPSSRPRRRRKWTILSKVANSGSKRMQ
jgi:hypothetical protein